jgi:hypothetical protein
MSLLWNSLMENEIVCWQSYCQHTRFRSVENAGELNRYVVKKEQKTYHNRSWHLKVSRNKICTAKHKFNTLDTIVNELVHDSTESEFEEGNWVKVRQRSPRISHIYQVCLCKILHKQRTSFRNKNKKFLLIWNRNSSEDIKKNTHRVGNLKRLQSW